jgi:hypothetical protein
MIAYLSQTLLFRTRAPELGASIDEAQYWHDLSPHTTVITCSEDMNFRSIFEKFRSRSNDEKMVLWHALRWGGWMLSSFACAEKDRDHVRLGSHGHC